MDSGNKKKWIERYLSDDSLLTISWVNINKSILTEKNIYFSAFFNTI